MVLEAALITALKLACKSKTLGGLLPRHDHVSLHPSLIAEIQGRIEDLSPGKRRAWQFGHIP